MEAEGVVLLSTTRLQSATQLPWLIPTADQYVLLRPLGVTAGQLERM